MALGRNGLVEMLERTCRHARSFAAGLAAEGYEILNRVALNQVLVSFGEDDTTEAVTAAIQREGTCWCGTSSWKGRKVMRISVSSWATTDDDVTLSLAAMVRTARQYVPSR
jgi:glutamate/tyrosine decarboxylase-like PLP-dependent enzyme